jgi:hypothetical protein
MMEKITLPKWMWWKKGECVVEILRRGNYPDTVMVRLPNDVETQVYQNELETNHGSNP